MQWLLGTTPVPAVEKVSKHLLVVDSDAKRDWSKLFEELGCDWIVHQGGFDEISLSCYGKKAMASISPRSGKGRKDLFQVSFCLIREECRGATPNSDHASVVYGLHFAGVPCVNSTRAVLGFLERPVVMGELLALDLPLVDQTFHSEASELLITPPAPFVCKIGHAHAGAGKMKLNSHRDLEDFRSVLLMTNHYVTSEPFVESTHELRIQRIGSEVRVYKRIGIGGSWKSNTGACILEDVEDVDGKYRSWTDQVQPMLGGLDIFAIDVICQESGEELILEVNPSSIGLHPDHANDDSIAIAKLCLERFS